MDVKSQVIEIIDELFMEDVSRHDGWGSLWLIWDEGHENGEDKVQRLSW